jgi:hypothetical protein
VPFNSETLVTGKLFEDIREAVFKLADPALYDAVVIINLCVPTASGVPLQLLPKEIDGVRSLASTCRVSGSRLTRRPRTCSPAPCCATPGARPSRGQWRRPARA